MYTSLYAVCRSVCTSIKLKAKLIMYICVLDFVQSERKGARARLHTDFESGGSSVLAYSLANVNRLADDLAHRVCVGCVWGVCGVRTSRTRAHTHTQVLGAQRA